MKSSHHMFHGRASKGHGSSPVLTSWTDLHRSKLLYSLLAEALFLVFADGRKETSAMDRNWLWFNRRPFCCPRSWTAVLQRMLLALLADLNLSLLRLAHFFTLILLSFIEPTLLDITRSFTREISIVKSYKVCFFFRFGLPRRWNDKKKLSEEHFKALFHFWVIFL